MEPLRHRTLLVAALAIIAVIGLTILGGYNREAPDTTALPAIETNTQKGRGVTTTAIPTAMLSQIDQLLRQEHRPRLILYDGEDADTGCLSWKVDPDVIDESLQRVRDVLQDKFVSYKGDLMWHDTTLTRSNTLVVCPSQDQFDIIRAERTDGANYGLGTEDIIKKLRSFDDMYGIDITGASVASVEFSLKRLPEGDEARRLGESLLAFAPDIYEPPEDFSAPIALWWD